MTASTLQGSMPGREAKLRNDSTENPTRNTYPSNSTKPGQKIVL